MRKYLSIFYLIMLVLLKGKNGPVNMSQKMYIWRCTVHDISELYNIFIHEYNSESTSQTSISFMYYL